MLTAKSTKRVEVKPRVDAQIQFHENIKVETRRRQRILKQEVHIERIPDEKVG